MSVVAELTNLINDTLSHKVSLFSEGASKYSEQAIRETFFEILGSDKLTYQTLRNHRDEIFTVIENVLQTNLPLAWDNSDFYNQFVETKNGAIGEKNEFVVKDNSILVASSFSGNHWDTDRQKLQGNKTFSVPTEWFYIRVYDELERFLNNNTSLEEMMAHLQKGFQNEIDSRIYASFNGIGTYLPAAFQETGTYSRDTMVSLIQKVQTASQSEVVIAGTAMALSEVMDGMNPNWISASQKEELATNGIVVNNIGLPAKAIVIPQTFIRGTYDFKVNNNTIYVLPAGDKLIKVYYEGDVRTLSLTSQDTHDQTFDAQVQCKVGIGVVCGNLAGRYKIVAA